MLRVSPPPPLPGNSWQGHGRQPSPRVTFRTRKGAKLPLHTCLAHPNGASSSQLEQNTNGISNPAMELLQLSSLQFEMEIPNEHRETTNADVIKELGTSFKSWVRTWPVPVRRLIAGGIAGAIGKTATAPLEAIKLQVVQGHMGTLQAAYMLYNTGNFHAFFRGNGLDVLRTVPAKGIELATFDTLKRFILLRTHKKKIQINEKLENTSQIENEDASRVSLKQEENILLPDALVLAAAGAIAGVLGTMAVHPLETIRTRLAVGKGACGVGAGALSCMAGIVREEGAGALFRGLDASIIGIIPYAAIRLGTYDALKRAYKTSTGEDHVSAQAALVFGAVAGVMSAVTTFPLEVARRRMMAGGAHGNLVATVVGIVSKEGVGALFNGVGVMLVKQVRRKRFFYFIFGCAALLLSM